MSDNGSEEGVVVGWVGEWVMMGWINGELIFGCVDVVSGWLEMLVDS